MNKKIFSLGLLFALAGILQVTAMVKKPKATQEEETKERRKVDKAYDEMFYVFDEPALEDAMANYKNLLNKYFPDEEPKWMPRIHEVLGLHRQRPQPSEQEVLSKLNRLQKDIWESRTQEEYEKRAAKYMKFRFKVPEFGLGIMPALYIPKWEAVQAKQKFSSPQDELQAIKQILKAKGL